MNEQGKKRKWRYKRSELPDFCRTVGSISVPFYSGRRLPEITDLYAKQADGSLSISPVSRASLSSGGGKRSSRHLRRRATSHKRTISHRFPSSTNRPSQESNSRRARRKRSRLQRSHDGSQTTQTATASLRWIPTHIWHAKRFLMCDLFGWKVPMIHSGRGVRAALRLVQDSCLVVDGSWSHQPIVVKSKDRLWMKRIMSAAHMTQNGSTKNFVGECVIHELDQYPAKAIGPASFVVVDSPLFAQEASSEFVHMYVFVHPCIRDQIYDLITKCTLEEDEVRSMESTLAYFKMYGRSASQTLTTLLEDGAPVDKLMDGSNISMIQCKWKESAELVVIRRDPNNDSEDAASGFDIICPLDTSRDVFHRMVTIGKACAIGHVEECNLRLEATIPIPTFPRDFPDTSASVHFWNGSTGEWITLRRCLEGGVGRVKTRGPPLFKIDFSGLMDGKSPVGVRGDHLAPFQSLLEDACSCSPPSPSRPTRRKRRNIQAVTTSKAPRLSQANACALMETVQKLTNSLQLPALVLCHLLVCGKGSLMPADEIVSNTSSDTLGFVTAECFSRTRGAEHGLGVISGRGYLGQIQELLESGGHFLFCDFGGSKEIHLPIRIQRRDRIVCAGALIII